MTIGAELEAQILRYYHVEKWRAGTIARQLHVHHGTVHRVLAQAGLPRIGGLQRPSQIDAYLPFIHETLKKFPSLTASRLYAMVCERGYRGNHHHFRHLISVHRPRPITEALFGRGVVVDSALRYKQDFREELDPSGCRIKPDCRKIKSASVRNRRIG
ncbi:hypothetical protein SAMN05446635_5332 [Burkholderia sp. OK233]|nr:hypothetical protein SAMN05446635_5332 [Burkholderia sp. OK233]